MDPFHDWLRTDIPGPMHHLLQGQALVQESGPKVSQSLKVYGVDGQGVRWWGGGGGVVVRAGQLTWVWASQAQVLDLQVVPKGPWGNLFWQQRIAGFRRTFLCRQSGGGGPCA